MNQEFDVIIIGAGAAGLMAAHELVLTGKKIAVLEATDRIGGRIHSVTDKNSAIPLEMGAEFVHGDAKQTRDLFKKAGIDIYEVNGDLWQKKENEFRKQKDFIEDYSKLKKKFQELDGDISVQQFFDLYLQDPEFEELRFTLQNYVEGYYAADINIASTYALKEELESSSEKQYRVKGGYKKLISYLFRETEKKGVKFFLSTPVNQINWKKNNISVKSGNREFISKKLLSTVSPGVIKSRSFQFLPAIENKINAAEALGFGPVIKILLLFEKAFWTDKKFTDGKDLSEMNFIFSEEKIPTWWSCYPEKTPLLTGWASGPNAKAFKGMTEEEILVTALDCLSHIFSKTTRENLLVQLKLWYVSNWMENEFTRGAYSFDVVDGSKYKKELLSPVEDTIFFAGEALYEGPEIGTVEAALVTGKEAAFRIVEKFI